MSTPAQDLARERYGVTPPSMRRRLWLLVAAALVLAVVLGWISWLTLIRNPQLTWQDIGYNVTSDAAVVVTFDVFFHGPGQSAVCTVQAQNELHTEVGLRDVTVRSGPKGRVRAVVTLPTSERATTGLVKACVIAS